jgi:hypothetical protein
VVVGVVTRCQGCGTPVTSCTLPAWCWRCRNSDVAKSYEEDMAALQGKLEEMVRAEQELEKDYVPDYQI